MIAALALCALCGIAAAGDDLCTGFENPPASARPWVYWFWLNGNITREGITADLEAMKRVGIGGVLIMEVDQGAPRGPVDFMADRWRELFRHVAAEAQRLGLEVNMNDDAGWNGSGGPWITPAESMQKVVWSETAVAGGRRFEGNLPQPAAVEGFYRDIAVLGMPTPGAYRIEGIRAKAAYGIDTNIKPASTAVLPAEMVIPREGVVDLTAKMDKDGKLVWDAPAGKWTVLRFGHTSTGAKNAPAPATGCGLECDKLSKEGSEAAFNGMMAKLIADVGPLAGKSLVSTHVDSWENGSQNWTARMRQEFQKRRGYDMLAYLPVMTGRVVGSLEISERFLADLRQTISDMVVENYAGHLRDLANKSGLRLSIEAYGGPCDHAPYAGRADEPMCEFWIGGGAFETCKDMSSAAHTYGKPIVGAESFTANSSERWLQHPATIKALGDRAMCQGVNRFVFHRYAMQPWLNVRPGMMMGPWGLHYERTETWWELSGPWHEYLARCHWLLRQGLFVADICRLLREHSPQGHTDYARDGYDFDTCCAEALLTRMQVKAGRLVLPDGISYRVLALPNSETMTPQLLRKIKELADAGAKIVGPRPARSPSLTDYPQCDAEVKKLGDELWASGKIVAGKSPEQVLAEMGVPADFKSNTPLDYIHRQAGGTDIYFVANSQPRQIRTLATFRVTGKQPELWWPETGLREPAAVFNEHDGLTDVSITLAPAGSVFVVFVKADTKADPVVSLTRDGQAVLPTAAAAAGKIVVTEAQYGVPGDPTRTRDVRQVLQRLLDAGQVEIHVSQMAADGDPAYGVVKTLSVTYTIEGKQRTVTGTDPETIIFTTLDMTEPLADVRLAEGGGLRLEAWQAGHYEVKTKSGQSRSCDVAALPGLEEIASQWQVEFDPRWGGPAKATFDKLVDWSKRPEDGIKYYSGTATYRTTFTRAEAPAKGARVLLDLGKVAIMAEVALNGQHLGILWKPPYRLDVTGVMRAGDNTLEIKVTNLLVNRMIGDELLPEDSDRNANGTLKQWPQWLLEGKPSPTGRYTFADWRLWKQGGPLQESGLLGPVTLRTGACVEVK
jgi:hypothetical protein